jgi:hypothetical protein
MAGELMLTCDKVHKLKGLARGEAIREFRLECDLQIVLERAKYRNYISKLWRRNHPEQVRKYQRKYYHAHKEEINGRKRRSRILA